MKVIFNSVPSEQFVMLGDKCGLELQSSVDDNSIDEVELIKGIERERGQAF